MLSVRSLSQEFYTVTFTLYTLTEGQTTNSHTGAPYVLAQSMLRLAAVTLLEVMFVTAVFNRKQNKKSQPSIIAKNALVSVSNSITNRDPRFENS